MWFIVVEFGVLYKVQNSLRSVTFIWNIFISDVRTIRNLESSWVFKKNSTRLELIKMFEKIEFWRKFNHFQYHA
jgi:hypothetical protein